MVSLLTSFKQYLLPKELATAANKVQNCELRGDCRRASVGYGSNPSVCTILIVPLTLEYSLCLFIGESWFCPAPNQMSLRNRFSDPEVSSRNLSDDALSLAFPSQKTMQEDGEAISSLTARQSGRTVEVNIFSLGWQVFV